jgi:ATP-dependent Clp protease ATP-binding subunit ClpB
MPHEIEDIVKIQFRRLIKTIEEQSIKLSLTDAAVKYIAKLSWDPVYGARPVKRTIQRQILNPLAELILAGKLEKDAEVGIDYDGEKIHFLY